MHYFFSKFGKFIIFNALSLVFIGACIILSLYLGQLLGIGKKFPSLFAEIAFFKNYYLELFVILLLIVHRLDQNKIGKPKISVPFIYERPNPGSLKTILKNLTC